MSDHEYTNYRYNYVICIVYFKYVYLKYSCHKRYNYLYFLFPALVNMEQIGAVLGWSSPALTMIGSPIKIIAV